MSVELLIQTKIGPFVCARIHLKKGRLIYLY